MPESKLRSGVQVLPSAQIYTNYAQGTKDFIPKLEIALKEASEICPAGK